MIVSNLPKTSRTLRPKPSRPSDLDINYEDIIYGEYSFTKKHGGYLDVIYLNGEKLKYISSHVTLHSKIIRELQILLKDEKCFYLIPIREIYAGFAFKSTDVTDIKSYLFKEGDSASRTPPWCGITFTCKPNKTYKIETEFQAYFTYQNTERPASLTNEMILEQTFSNN